ncbi:lytic murein transglycosylase B [Rugamonas brunnea]|uniref:lytic murein transglycosylase B n=1 Tax=Rugamonas brunnea TaxID=2758569 RepID=UPI0040574308
MKIMPSLSPSPARWMLALLLAAAPLAQAAVDPYGYKLPPSQRHKQTKVVKKKGPPPVDYVGEFVNFGEWKDVRAFLDDLAARDGFDRAALDSLMGQVRYVDAAVQLIKPAPPGKPKNWQAYSKLFIDPVRIDAGVKFWNENQDALARAEALYGVPAEILVGIIGVETVYGRNTGRFRVLDALTTLAFSYPEAPARDERMAFFRSELEATLLFARQNGIDPLSLRGSYAGAVGMPQFMPSSIVKYAVDFDGNGKVDLLGSSSDAIGSVAAFLTAHGWRRDDPGPLVYAAEVSPNRAWEGMINQGLAAKFPAQDLTAAGVSTTSALPSGMVFGLVDLQNGADPTEYWVATNNFYAITQYNRSYFYAMSVVELGRAVRLSRGAGM